MEKFAAGGVVLSAYFAGFTVGALRSGRLIARSGHIRAVAAFAGLWRLRPLSCLAHDRPMLRPDSVIDGPSMLDGPYRLEAVDLLEQCLR